MKFVVGENGRNPEKNLPRSRFVHHETHMEWPRCELGTPSSGRRAPNRLRHEAAIIIIIIIIIIFIIIIVIIIIIIIIFIILTQNGYSTIFLPVVRHKELENKFSNNVKMTNTESLVNKNHYSVSEHTHDENEWEIFVTAEDLAIKWEYYDAKNHEIIVS